MPLSSFQRKNVRAPFMIKFCLLIAFSFFGLESAAQDCSPLAFVEALAPMQKATSELVKINVQEAEEIANVYEGYKPKLEPFYRQLEEASSNLNRILQEEREKNASKGKGGMSRRAKAALRESNGLHDRFSEPIRWIKEQRDLDVTKVYSEFTARRVKVATESGVSEQMAAAINESLSVCASQEDFVAPYGVKLPTKSGGVVKVCTRQLEGMSWSVSAGVDGTAYTGGEINRIFGFSSYDGRVKFVVLPKSAGQVAILRLPEMFDLLPGMVYFDKDQSGQYWRYGSRALGLCAL